MNGLLNECAALRMACRASICAERKLAEVKGPPPAKIVLARFGVRVRVLTLPTPTRTRTRTRTRVWSSTRPNERDAIESSLEGVAGTSWQVPGA